MFNIEKTTEYKAVEELTEMDKLSSNALLAFTNLTQQAYNAFWKGDVSPEIKIQLLGTKALEVFTLSATAQAFIKSVNPEHEELAIPEGYSIEWNKDGSGIITYTEPVVEEEVVISEE